MNVIAADLAQRFPDTNKGRRVSVEPLQNNFLSADRQANLWLLLAAVSFVVLIACVNVANLLLSRGAARERETVVRAALGATRGRLARQALTESLSLAAAGGTLGALSSVWILKGILAILPRGTLPSEADPRLSLPVLLFTLVATMMCGVLCGSVQAWQASRADSNDTLKQAGRSATGSGRRRPSTRPRRRRVCARRHVARRRGPDDSSASGTARRSTLACARITSSPLRCR